MGEEKKEVEYKDWVPTKTLLKAVVVDEGGSCLVLRRAKKDWDKRSEKWDINGGALDRKDVIVGSKPHQIALRREILEESGLEVKGIESVGYFNSGAKISINDGNIPICVIGFRCEVGGIKPEVYVSGEHTEFMWATKDEALTLDFGEDDGMCKAIIQKAFT